MKIRAAVLDQMQQPQPYAKSKPISVETIELDAPGPGEVLVKMAAAGLCHSDLSVINGEVSALIEHLSISVIRTPR